MKRVYAATYNDSEKMEMNSVIEWAASKLGLSVAYENATIWFYKTVNGAKFKFAVSENTMYKLVSKSRPIGAAKYNTYNYLKTRMQIELADQQLD